MLGYIVFYLGDNVLGEFLDGECPDIDIMWYLIKVTNYNVLLLKLGSLLINARQHSTE